MVDRRSNKDKAKPLPSQGELQRVLNYYPSSGILTWKERPRTDFSSDRSHKVWNKRYADMPALNGVGKKGYRVGHLFGQMVRSSRVIWKMVTGLEPILVDHQNGDKTDNSWENLRNVGDAENMKNKAKYASNKSGVSGVYWNKAMGKWHAQMKVGELRLHLGFFDSLEEARVARSQAEHEHDFHPNHGRKAH